MIGHQSRIAPLPCLAQYKTTLTSVGLLHSLNASSSREATLRVLASSGNAAPAVAAGAILDPMLCQTQGRSCEAVTTGPALTLTGTMLKVKLTRTLTPRPMYWQTLLQLVLHPLLMLHPSCLFEVSPMRML